MRDTVGIIRFALVNSQVKGPINLVAPKPATNGEFFNSLGSVLKKKVVGNMPSFVIRAALGEFSEALLESQRVIPAKIVDAGYAFQDVELYEYLCDTM